MNFCDDLIKWYQQEKKELPWRKDKDPYHIWISEIMLQQTRIEAVIPYYFRFLEKLPSIFELAKIEEDELLKLWQGLGYYNRARNLKKAAIKIVEEYQGVFPNQYEAIKNLPGIGEYTAGAISSICFSLKYPAVDGNVLRVMSRLYLIEKSVDDQKLKKEVSLFLKNHMPDNSGDFNQALMELGENICLSNGNPLCEVCPIQKYCKAYQENRVFDFPIKSEKKKKREEDYTVLAYVCDGKIAIQKRSEGLLKNLYEFPNVLGKFTKSKIQEKHKNCNLIKIKPYQHIFTHIIWNIKGYIIELEDMNSSYLWVSLDALDSKYAIPTAFQPVLKDIKRYFHEYK